MNRNQFDVILVGGGVMSCATATYLLRTEPNLQVGIIEMDPTYARNSTTLSDGNIRVQFNVKENIQMTLYALEVFERFAEEMAVGDDKPDVAFRQQGDLFLVDAAGREAAERGLALQQQLGGQVEWLEPDEIKRRYPLIDAERCVGGTFGYQDGTMDPNAVLIAYKNKAVALGAHFIRGRVTELVRNGNRIAGVKLADGQTIQGNAIVNAAGAWAAQIAETAGVMLPIQPVKRQVFVLETAVRPEGVLPLIVLPTGLYLIQEHGNHFLCGQSFDDDPIGLDDFDWSRQRFIDRLWEDLVDYIPAFDRLKVVSGWAGLYAVNTFDGNAILGEWPDLQGFYLANGFSGHGFQQCHAVGRYLSELILGLPPALDLSIFSPNRILENRPVFEGESRLV
jgi:glycine/D-amino acid oxidase-like deaminating enzyme